MKCTNFVYFFVIQSLIHLEMANESLWLLQIYDSLFLNCGNQLNLWRNILESISICKSLYVIWQECLIPKKLDSFFHWPHYEKVTSNTVGNKCREYTCTSSGTHFWVMRVKRTCLKELTRMPIESYKLVCTCSWNFPNVIAIENAIFSTLAAIECVTNSIVTEDCDKIVMTALFFIPMTTKN